MSRLQTLLYTFFIFILFSLLEIAFSGKLILPQELSLGFIRIRYYGIIMAAALFAGYALLVSRSARFGITKAGAERVIFWGIVGGFIGARLYHVFSSWGYYAAHPEDIVKVWNGGLGIYGAVAGGLLAGLIVYRISRTLFIEPNSRSLLTLLDWATPGLVLGQIIGRFGNFFNYEAFGYPTALPWKMFVPEEFRPHEFVTSTYFHPLFLYEAIGNSLLLLFLLRYGKVQASGLPKPRLGAIFFSYLIGYNIVRFCIEFLRIDSVFIGSVRLNSITSLLLVLSGIGGMWWLSNARRSKPS